MQSRRSGQSGKLPHQVTSRAKQKILILSTPQQTNTTLHSKEKPLHPAKSSPHVTCTADSDASLRSHLISDLTDLSSRPCHLLSYSVMPPMARPRPVAVTVPLTSRPWSGLVLVRRRDNTPRRRRTTVACTTHDRSSCRLSSSSRLNSDEPQTRHTSTRRTSSPRNLGTTWA